MTHGNGDSVASPKNFSDTSAPTIAPTTGLTPSPTITFIVSDDAHIALPTSEPATSPTIVPITAIAPSAGSMIVEPLLARAATKPPTKPPTPNITYTAISLDTFM